MKKSHFEKLVESVRQAGHVRRDELRPSREFRFAPTDIKAVRAKLPKSHSQFALMIGVSERGRALRDRLAGGSRDDEQDTRDREALPGGHGKIISPEGHNFRPRMMQMHHAATLAPF
jgi:hypothetical protein